PANVMVGLDPFGFGPLRSRRLNNIRIDRPLHQKPWQPQSLGLLLKHPDKFLADNFSFPLGVSNSLKRREKFISSIDCDQFGMQMIPKCRSDLGSLVLSQQTCIYKHRDQLVADRFM